MNTIDLFKSSQKRLLVTRESAHMLDEEVRSALREDGNRLSLDFTRVEGVSPSFLDELLQVVRQASGEETWRSLAIRIANPPTRLSSKFEAVGRGHGLVVTQSDGGDWLLKLEEASASGRQPS